MFDPALPRVCVNSRRSRALVEKGSLDPAVEDGVPATVRSRPSVLNTTFFIVVLADTDTQDPLGSWRISPRRGSAPWGPSQEVDAEQECSGLWLTRTTLDRMGRAHPTIDCKTKVRRSRGVSSTLLELVGAKETKQLPFMPPNEETNVKGAGEYRRSRLIIPSARSASLPRFNRHHASQIEGGSSTGSDDTNCGVVAFSFHEA